MGLHPRRSDDEDDGASGVTASTRTTYSSSSSCFQEDFQQWSKETKAFFAGMIKDSEMMLEWASDQTTEITKTAIDLEFLPTDMNEGRGVQNLEFILQQMHTMLMDITSGEANDMVNHSRKNPLEALRRQQERYDPSSGVKKINILRKISSPGRCSLQELQAGFERWESYVERYEKMKGKMNDEIKPACLEALVPEELENQLIFNSNHLGTLEDARCEVVTYMEEMFDLRISDFTPSEAVFCERSDATDVEVVSSLLSGKGKWSSDSLVGVFFKG